MALYTKVSGVWKTVDKVYTRVSGIWKNVDMIYTKVSGVWKGLFASEYVYTFTANASNVGFAALIGAANVAAYQKFKIIVNAGVTISGTNGVDGAAYPTNDGTYDSVQLYVSPNYIAGGYNTRICLDPRYGYALSLSRDAYFIHNGANGSAGKPALNLSGLSGKTITIINNGTIKGGNGGKGGAGANPGIVWHCAGEANCGLTGAVGTGVVGVLTGTNTTTISGNNVINGSAGVNNTYGWRMMSQSCCGGCG